MTVPDSSAPLSGTTGPSSPIDLIADQFVDAISAADPVSATEWGLAGYDDRLTDLSPEGFEERHRITRAAYDAAKDCVPDGERQAVAREAFLERLGLQLEMDEAGYTRSDFNVIASGLHDLRSTFDLMPTETEEHWGNIRARLSAVRPTLDGYRRTLLAGVETGQVAARRQYAEVASQISQWTGQRSTPSVFTTLVGLAPEGTLRAELDRAAAEATEAVADFGRFLEAEMVPAGREKDAVGEEHYRLASRYFLGAVVDLRETYEWGWQELARLHGEMQMIAEHYVPGGSIADAVAHLDADPTRNLGSKEEFRDWMQLLADRVIEELAGVHFDIPEPVRRIECCLAPTQDGAIYYTGPSEDFSRPGRMWWAVPETQTTFSTWREATTVFHEGVPGHHLQIGQTAYRRDLLNRWRRLLCWVSGSGEGWALYAERLMEELGYLDDPADRLGMLDGQSMRAARVVVDIGMHLELEIPEDNPFGFHPGETWTPELGLELMLDHTQMDEAVMRFEVNRYLGWPGQAPAYKVGERLWLQARDDAEQRKGADFDLKQFHRDALDLGSIGLDPLAAALSRL